MWHALKGLLETTWESATRRDAFLGIAWIVITSIAILFSIRGDSLYTEHRVLCYTLLVILYFSAIVPPIARMIRERHHYVLYVVLWGLISLTFVLVMFYLYFFALADTDEVQKRWERVLNLPPVLAGALAAAIGWYAVNQFSARMHRTNNSFSLVMQTRCNTEFVRNAFNLTRAYPPPCALGEGDRSYFASDARLIAEDLKLKKQNSALTQQEAKRLNEEYKLAGVEAFKYLLNFYEFMAYGISAGDLDEDLLYQTISPAVVSVYRRAKLLRKFVNDDD